jgi:hypothetical protein
MLQQGVLRDGKIVATEEDAPALTELMVGVAEAYPGLSELRDRGRARPSGSGAPGRRVHGPSYFDFV